MSLFRSISWVARSGLGATLYIILVLVMMGIPDMYTRHRSLCIGLQDISSGLVPTPRRSRFSWKLPTSVIEGSTGILRFYADAKVESRKYIAKRYGIISYLDAVVECSPLSFFEIELLILMATRISTSCRYVNLGWLMRFRRLIVIRCVRPWRVCNGSRLQASDHLRLYTIFSRDIGQRSWKTQGMILAG